MVGPLIPVLLNHGDVTARWSGGVIPSAGTFDDQAVARVLQLDVREQPLSLMPIGKFRVVP